MMINDERWLAVTDAIHAAAMDPKGWYSALEALAQITGSRCGQLICIGNDASIPLNIMTNLDPAAESDFVACSGGDPQVNPRVGAGTKAPVLKVLAEEDFIRPDEHARNPHYQEFALPWDIPFICLTTLARTPNMLVGLAVLRSQQQGHIDARQREIFASIAPHVRAAVRTHMMIEDHSAALIAGAMEALSIPAFICDGSGRVRALSPAAEALVNGERGLQLRLGNLCAENPLEMQALKDAIEGVARGNITPGPPPQRTVVLRGKRAGASPLVLDVIALPRRQYQFNFVPRVLIVSRGTRATTERKSALLQALYALTVAETDIAMQLTAGKTAEAIATARSVAVGTVRAQIKTVLAKIGVRRQVELVARLSDL